jgi:hypothetical protein
MLELSAGSLLFRKSKIHVSFCMVRVKSGFFFFVSNCASGTDFDKWFALVL